MADQYFYNTDPFLSNQGEPCIMELSQGISNARIAWFKKNAEGFSPLKAPFGSIEIQGPYSNSLTNQLIEKLLARLRDEKVTSITITMPPDGYNKEAGFLISKAYENYGFNILFQDFNFHIEVNSEFRKHLHRSERWKLNKSIREGYTFRKVEIPDWEETFNLLQESRERKGFLLSMDRLSLEKSFKDFPEKYQLFSVLKDEKTVAIAVTIRVNKEILYVFYTADSLIHRKLSPVVLLHNGIYQYCISEKIEILDLGTCSLKGQVNSGVANFKKNLGGIVSLKNTFIKRFQ